MGEYAKYNGEQIKIGTCEDMYYLRADQASKVQALRGNVDPVKDRAEIRFRFPWPDEDNVAPGAFDNYDRGLGLHGIKVPEGVGHGSVQFTAPGYNISLVCPEVEEGPSSDHGLKFHRNGHPGPVRIVQQRWFEGKLVLICACGGCGSRYRLPTLEDARPVIEAVRKEAKHRPDSADFYEEIAKRIEAGYSL